jgi:hypothetical protein
VWSRGSRLIVSVRSLFVAGTILFASFAATELLLALGLAKMFVVHALDESQDPTYAKRLIIAVLLVASYEVVALSNLFLAISTFAFVSKLNKRKRDLLVAILLLAWPFRLCCFFSEPIAPARNGRPE